MAEGMRMRLERHLIGFARNASGDVHEVHESDSILHDLPIQIKGDFLKFLWHIKFQN